MQINGNVLMMLNVNVIIVKVYKSALVMMNVDDETNEDENDNDF
jgi:hypothetical protein